MGVLVGGPSLGVLGGGPPLGMLAELPSHRQVLYTEESVTAGSAALAAKQRMHNANYVKCSELGWRCVPLAVESYGCWGTEARQHLARLASRLATRYNIWKSQATSSLYRRLNLTLVRVNDLVQLSRPMSFQDTCVTF